jgi:hypothetical protein
VNAGKIAVAAAAAGLLVLTACASAGPAASHPATHPATNAAVTVPGHCYARSAGVTVAVAGKGRPSQCAAWAETLTALFPSRPPFAPSAPPRGILVCPAGAALVYADSSAWVASAQNACNMISTALAS